MNISHRLNFCPSRLACGHPKKTRIEWQLALYNNIPAHEITSSRDTSATRLQSAVYLGVHYDRWGHAGSYTLWGITPDPSPKGTVVDPIEVLETRNLEPTQDKTVKKNTAIESLTLGSAALGLLDIGDVRVSSLGELVQVIQGPNAALIFPNLGASALAATAN